MASVPARPFSPDDFSPLGGGVDFLGMRWVNLTMLGEMLLPGINNQTCDFGIYCLATWIPWKFKQLTDQRDFSLEKFRKFEEVISVAIAHSIQTESASISLFGETHKKIGVRQEIKFPSRLTFDLVARDRSTSIFAPALYGPSLRYLGLIDGNALATDGTSTEIPLTSQSEGPSKIVEAVDNALARSRYFEKLLDPNSEFQKAELDDLGEKGINPAYFRTVDRDIKTSFLAQLVPNDGNNYRTRTAKLLVATLEQLPSQDLDEIRSAWHTGIYPNGASIQFEQDELNLQRNAWSVFQSRQYQRYVVELFMKCFEEGLTTFATIDDIVRHYVATEDLSNATLEDIIRTEAEQLLEDASWLEVSTLWNQSVHGAHELYVKIEEGQMPDFMRALKMLSRWWLRTYLWIDAKRNPELLGLGGEDRISITWFHQWVADRLDQPISAFISDVFEQLIFGQHIRVALSRFDGSAQKLRFLLGDDGIVPAKSAQGKMGKSTPSWMSDRLQVFVDLLSDIEVLIEEDGKYRNGPLASIV